MKELKAEINHSTIILTFNILKIKWGGANSLGSPSGVSWLGGRSCLEANAIILFRDIAMASIQ
jgi:hypothetical protein